MIESLFAREPSGQGRKPSVHDGIDQAKSQNVVTGNSGEAEGNNTGSFFALFRVAEARRGHGRGHDPAG